MRWIFRLIGAVVVMAAVILGRVAFLPSDRIAQIAADQLSKATGRAVTLSGETTLSLYPILGVSTGAVEVANADWSGAGPMLRAESLKVGVAPMPLLRGEIRITGLEIAQPQIRLERAADGRVNWDPRGRWCRALGAVGRDGTGEIESAGADPRPGADHGGVAALYRSRHGAVQEIRDMDFDLRWPDYEGRATFQAVLRQAGAPVTIDGHVDRLGAFLDGEVTPVMARVNGPGGRVRLRGARRRDTAGAGAARSRPVRHAAPFWRRWPWRGGPARGLGDG